MAINVTPIPGLDPEINDIRRRTADFINAEILPNEEVLWRSRRGRGARPATTESTSRRRSIEMREEIKAKVNQAGLWAPHLPKEYGGMGLDFLALAYMYEILAYAVGASTLFGIAAPNSGNASILVKYGTEEQKRKWLLPLIDGTHGVRLLDDRAGQCRIGPALDRDRGRPRRRPLGDQRAQVVHLQRHRRRLLHRDVPGQRSHRRARRARAG